MPIQYELFYLVGDTKEAELPRIKGEVEKIVADHGGTWLEKEVVEKRKLAYPVKKEARGTYIAKRFTLPGQDERPEGEAGKNAVAEMNRVLQLYHDVLRFIIVRADDLPSLDSREEALKNMPVAQRRPVQQGRGGMRRPYGGAPRPSAAPAVAPVISTPPAEEKPEVTSAEIDKQLDEVLDKKLPNI